jgi:hypothetical protein
VQNPIKIIWVFLVSVSVSAIAADDTNSFPFVTIQGQTYTNACISTVTPAYAVILYDGGGRLFALSNLPPFLQKRFGYDPAKAEQYLAAEAVKRQEGLARIAAAVAQAEAAEGDPENVTILSIEGGFPVRCLIKASSGQEDVFMNGLPGSVVEAFSMYDAAKQQLDALSDQAAALRNNSNALKAKTTGSGQQARGNIARMQRVRTTSAAQEADRATQQLTSFKKDFALLEKDKMRSSIVNAVSTGMIYGVTPIWRFLSITNESTK